MDRKKVDDLCTKLMQSRDWPHEEQEIEELWAPIKDELSREEQISLLTCVVEKDNIFRWLHLISHYTPELLSESEDFIYFLEIVLDKIKDDMAQGIFIRGLIKAGEKEPQKGVSLYSKLIEFPNDLVISYSGLILGGAAKVNFDEVFDIIERDLGKDEVPVKIACLKALRVASETKRADLPPRILDILDEMWKLEDPNVRMEVIRGYMAFRYLNPEEYENRLLEIAKAGSSRERIILLYGLWFEKLADQSIEIQILHIASEDNNVKVLESVMRVLSQKGKAFFDDSLKIIRRILEKSPSYSMPSFEYAVRKLCEGNWDVCNAVFDEWHESEKDAVFRLRLMTLRNRLSGKSKIQKSSREARAH